MKLKKKIFVEEDESIGPPGGNYLFTAKEAAQQAIQKGLGFIEVYVSEQDLENVLDEYMKLLQKQFNKIRELKKTSSIRHTAMKAHDPSFDPENETTEQIYFYEDVLNENYNPIPFKAKYQGTCAECNLSIEEDQMIQAARKISNSKDYFGNRLKYQHVECPYIFATQDKESEEYWEMRNNERLKKAECKAFQGSKTPYADQGFFSVPGNKK